jgi:large subunit ribosomal protein L15
MKLHDLRSPAGARKNRKRIGRGISAGQGKTSGRGQKGQFSRSSPGLPKGFEGGQMPLTQRLPKLRGFHNRFRREFAVVNVSKLNRFDGTTVVDNAALAAAGLISRLDSPVKLLGAGRLKTKVTVRVARASVTAQEAVRSAGGTIELLEPNVPKVARELRVRTRPAASGSEDGADETPAASAKDAAPAAADQDSDSSE